MQKLPICPYLEREDGRCAERLSLESLRDTFVFCAGDYASCSIYREIRLENEVPAGETRRARSA